MNITTPSLVLTFLGNDLETGHSTSQTISNQYIVNNSIKFKKTLMSGLKSASNQVALSLSKNCPSIEDIIATDGDIKAVLKDGQSTLFTGYISTSFSWKVTKTGEQILQITLEDVSTRLLTKPFIETGYHLFNATVADAVDDICDAADITISSSAIAITDRVTYVAEAGQTCKELLEQMLYEVGYVYYCDNLGELRFFKIDCTSTSDLPVLDKANLYEQNGQAVTLTKKIRQYRSVRMTYTALATAGDYLIYRNTTGQDDNHPYCNMELQSGEHFDGLEIYTPQEWSEATADQFREPALVEACNAASETELVGSNKIIAIAELRSDVQKGANITVSMVDAGGPYIEINAQNNGLSAESITKMDLYANILYEKSKNIVRTGISGGSTDSLYTEDCEFIHSKALMTRHANLVCQYNAYCNSKYTFFSDSDIELGSLIHLSENVFSGLAVDVMVTGKTVSDDTPVIKYEAIGISVFSLDDDVYHRDTDTGKANTKGEKGAGSVWKEGTVLVGTTYARGVVGNEGDYYLNTETFNIYRCIVSGGTNTALWQYTGNIKGKDYNVTGYTYEIEYGLSTSPDEFIYVDTTLGYDSSNAYGYQQDREYGFYDYGWGPTTEGWYHGLYVWQRIKITDENGDIHYEDPTYAAELTQSLEDSCTIELSAIPDAYTSNLRKTDNQYLFLSIKDVGYRGVLNLVADTGIFASYDASTEEWTDLTNALAITFSGTNLVSDYGIKLPYAMENIVTISGTFEEWTEEQFSISSLSISPSIEKSLAVQLKTIDTYSDLPEKVNESSLDATIDDNLIKGDYILVKFITLEAQNTTQATDETGKIWNISELSSYYDSNFDPITVSAFVVGTTYYAFSIYAWMYDGTQWARNASSAVQVNTVKEAVELAKEQHEIDSTVDYHRCLYAHKILVDNLTAGIINAGDVFANNITSNNYSEVSDPTQIDYGTPLTGFKLEHTSDREPNGQIKSFGGVFNNMNVRGGLNLYSNDGHTAGAQIQHPAFTTTAGTPGDVSGGASVPVISPSTWDISALYGNSSLTPNYMYESAVGMYNHLYPISRCARITNPSAAYIVGTSELTKQIGWRKDVVNRPQTSFAQSITFTQMYNNTLGKWVNDSAGISIFNSEQDYINNNPAETYSDIHTPFTVTLQPGQLVSARISRSTSSSTSQTADLYYQWNEVSFSSIGLSSAGFWIEYSNSWHNLGTSGTMLTAMYLTSPISWYDTGHYQVPLAFLTYSGGSSSMIEGIPYKITSTSLVYNEQSVVGEFFTKNSNGSRTLTFRNPNTDSRVNITMNSGQYWCLSGTIVISPTEEGVNTKSMYPVTTGLYDVGSSGLRYQDGYFNFVHGTPDGSSLRASKKNIVPYTGEAVKLLNSVEIMNYILITDKEEIVRTGFIADDTDEALASPTHDRMLYDCCIGVLIKAVQELSAEITKLKGGNN